jgi:hypothetical protein
LRRLVNLLGLALLWQILTAVGDSHMWNDPAVKDTFFLC